MARILCCWERGAGLGHLASLRPFVEGAVAAGHEVTLVVQNVQNVPTVFREIPVRLLQAPLGRARKREQSAPSIQSIGMMLEGFYGGDSTFLRSLCRAWEGLFDLVRPDLVIYDHSPTALIASLGQPWKKWIIGSGFMIPRTDEVPFGQFPKEPGTVIPPNTNPDLSDALRVDLINTYLRQKGETQISDLGDIWRQADRNWLLTLPELDHFGERPHATYLGIPPERFGAAVSWPDRSGPKVVGYLAHCAALHPLLEQLNRLPINGVFYTRDLSVEEIAQYPNLTICPLPLNLPLLLKDADLMINMAGHKTVSETYLAGVPQLMIVTHQEQLLLFWRIIALRAGVGLSAHTTEVAKPLQAAFALMEKGVPTVGAERAEEMRGAKLIREIQAAFDDMR